MVAIAVELASAYVSLSANTSTIPKDVRKALGQAEYGADKSGQSIGKKMSSGLGKALKVGGLAAGATAAAAIGTSLTKGFQRLDAIEQAQTKFEALGYTAKQQSGLMDDITASVKGTAFATSDAADAAAMALAGGIKPGKELTGVLKTVGDSASFANKGFSEVAPIFTQAINRGKVMGDTLARLEDNAIPATQALAKSMGKTAEEIQDMASKGEISFEDLQKAMDGTIGGQALKAGETFQGSLANIGAAMGRLGETILKGPFNAAPGVFSKVSDGIDVLNEKLGGTIELFSTGDFNGDIASKLGVDEDSAVVDRILSAREAVEKMRGSIELFSTKDFNADIRKKLGVEEDDALVDRILNIRDSVDKMRGSMELFFTGDFNGGIREKLGVEEDDPLVDQILTIRDAFVDWGERVGNVFREIGDLALSLAPSFGRIAAELGKATAKVSAATWEALLRIVEALVPVLEKVLVPAFELLAKTMEDHPRLVETLVFAFAGLKVIKLVSGPLKAIGGIAKGASGGFKLLSGALGAGKAAGKGGKIGAALLHISSAAKGGTGVVGKLGGAATKAVGGLTLFGRIGAGLSKVFGPVSKVLGGVVGKLGLKGLLGVVGKVALKFVPFIGWIWTAYEALKWFFTKTETGKKVFEGLKNVLSNVWNWIKDTFVAGFQWAGDKLGSMWDGITSAWNTAWDGITSYIEWAWGNLKAVWNAVGQPVVDFIVSAWDKIYIGIRIAFNIVKATFEAAWIALGMIWENVGQPQVDRVKYAFEMLWEGLKTVFGWIRSWWDWLWQGFKDAYQAYIVPVIDWIKGAFQALKDGLSWYWETMKQNWSNLWGFIRRMYDTHVQPIVDGVVNAFNRMRDGVVAAWDWIKTKIQEFASWVGGKISEIGTVIMGLYHQHVAPLVDYIRGGVDRIVSFFTGMKDRLLGVLSGAKEWLVQAGKWLIEGLWNGIKSMGSWITDKLTSWIPDKIKKPFENVLEFGSPSKLFKQYGKWLIEGLAIGVDSMGNKIEKSMVGIADRVAGVDMPTVQVSAQLNDQGLNVEASAQNVSTKVTGANPAPSSRYEGGAPPAVQSVEQGTESFEASSEAVNASVQATFDPAVQQADLSMTGFGANVQATATGVVTPQWQGMATNVANAARGVIAPAFGAVQAGLSNTGARFVQQTTGVMTPMWNAMGANVQRVRQAVTDPAMAGIRSALSATGAHFTNSVNGTINPVWSAMGNHVKAVKDGTVLPVFNAVEGGLTKLSGWFGTSVNNIGTAWSRMRAATAKPARFVVETVFNNGIRNAWNAVADLIDEKKIKPVGLGVLGGYASGGVLPGYTPGRDVHHFASPTGGRVSLSGGEAIMRPEWTRAVGGEGAVNAMNKAAKRGGVHGVGRLLGQGAQFADGGVINKKIAKTMKDVRKEHGKPYQWGGVGNPSWDCSGLWSGVVHSLNGRNMRSGRLFNTTSLMANPGAFGFKKVDKLTGRVTVGVSGDHMAGTIDGVNIESASMPKGVQVGGSAWGSDNGYFPNRYTLADFFGKFISGGMGSDGGASMAAAIQNMMAEDLDKIPPYRGGNGKFDKAVPKLKDKMIDRVTSYVEKQAEKLMASTSGGSGGSAERYRPAIKRAFRFQNEDPTNERVSALVRQIWTESKGDPNIAQQIVDVNGTGESAGVGLYQVIPSTWQGYRDTRLPDDRRNEWAAHNFAVRYFRDRHNWNTGPGGVGIPGRGWKSGGVLPSNLPAALFDNGGYLQDGQVGQNQSGKPEPVFTHKQWQILKGNIMSAAQAGELKKLQINLGIVANGLQQAVAKLDWQEIFGAASKAFNDKFFEDQAADVRSVFGIPDPDSIPAVKAYAEFRENEKKLNEEQAQAAKESREAATRADSAADKISGAPVPVKAGSESVSVGSQVARTGALVSRALANPNPATFAAAANSAGQVINNINVVDDSRAYAEFRKMEAKRTRGRVGAR